MPLPSKKIEPPHDASEITDVQIQGVHRGRLKAFATVVLGGSFVVRGIKLIQGHDRMFVAMPSRKLRDGSFQDIAHPSTQPFRQYLEAVVIEMYRQEMARTETEVESAGGR